MKLTDKIKAVLEGRQRQGVHDEEGRLICDPKPLKFNTGISKPPTREQQLAQILHRHEHLRAFNARYEDETDFDIENVPDASGMIQPDMLTPYERQAHFYEMTNDYPAEVVSGDTDTPPPEAAPTPPKEA